jgi:hypothetical protein
LSVIQFQAVWWAFFILEYDQVEPEEYSTKNIENSSAREPRNCLYYSINYFELSVIQFPPFCWAVFILEYDQVEPKEYCTKNIENSSAREPRNCISFYKLLQLSVIQFQAIWWAVFILEYDQVEPKEYCTKNIENSSAREPRNWFSFYKLLELSVIQFQAFWWAVFILEYDQVEP